MRLKYMCIAAAAWCVVWFASCAGGADVCRLKGSFTFGNAARQAASFVENKAGKKTLYYLCGTMSEKKTDTDFWFKEKETDTKVYIVSADASQKTLRCVESREQFAPSRIMQDAVPDWTVQPEELWKKTKKFAKEKGTVFQSIHFWTSPVCKNILVMDLEGENGFRYRLNADMISGELYEEMPES